MTSIVDVSGLKNSKSLAGQGNMTVTVQQKQEIAYFNPDQVALIKNYLCKGINDEELKLFHAVCKKTGLDPFMKQIYAVKRNGKDGPQMTIQTSIDGYRLIAERTGKYCPGRRSTFEYKDGKVSSATAYIKKQTADGTWHEVEETAYYSEYAPPVTKNGYENPFWRDKPHIMLAKCAEALALRKSFPNELSSVYTKEEMDQAVNTEINAKSVKPIEIVSLNQAAELDTLLISCTLEYQEKFVSWLKERKGIESLEYLPLECYENIKQRLTAKAQENTTKYGEDAING